MAHPAKIEHKRSVFVGNLGFVDDESGMHDQEEEEGKRKRGKQAGDTEEGLWRVFGKCGNVTNVRVVRDEVTRVGKGFGFVEFEVCLLLLSDLAIFTVLPIPFHLSCLDFLWESSECTLTSTGSQRSRIRPPPRRQKVSSHAPPPPPSRPRQSNS